MEEEIEFDLIIRWDIPLHLTRVVGYVLFRKYLGKEDRGGTCSIGLAENEEECFLLGGEWTDSCAELNSEGDELYKSNDIDKTFFNDSVSVPGIWRYAVFAEHESGELTLCTTNTFLARDIYTLTVISDHGDIFGNTKILEGKYSQFRVVPHEGWEFSRWESEDHVFEDPAISNQTILMDSDKTITAVFEIKKLKTEISANPENLGKLENVQEYYEYGTITDIDAVGIKGGTLQEWILFDSDDNYIVLEDPYLPELSIEMKKDIVGYAVFRRQRFEALPVSTEQGDAYGGGYGFYGDRLFVMAVKKNDPEYDAYIFERWEATPEINAFIINDKSPNTLIEIYGNVEIKAIFSIPDPEANFKLLDGINEYGGNLLTFTDNSYDAQDNIVLYRWTNSLNSEVVEGENFNYITPLGFRGDLPFDLNLTLYVEDSTGFSSTYTEAIKIKLKDIIPPNQLSYDIKGFADNGLLLIKPPIVTKADSILVYNNIEYTKKLYN